MEFHRTGRILLLISAVVKVLSKVVESANDGRQIREAECDYSVGVNQLSNTGLPRRPRFTDELGGDGFVGVALVLDRPAADGFFADNVSQASSSAVATPLGLGLHEGP